MTLQHVHQKKHKKKNILHLTIDILTNFDFLLSTEVYLFIFFWKALFYIIHIPNWGISSKPLYPPKVPNLPD